MPDLPLSPNLPAAPPPVPCEAAAVEIDALEATLPPLPARRADDDPISVPRPPP